MCYLGFLSKICGPQRIHHFISIYSSINFHYTFCLNKMNSKIIKNIKNIIQLYQNVCFFFRFNRLSNHLFNIDYTLTERTIAHNSKVLQKHNRNYYHTASEFIKRALCLRNIQRDLLRERNSLSISVKTVPTHVCKF